MKQLQTFCREYPALVFVLVYFAFQALMVTFVSNGAGLDDAEQLSYIGIIEWGYGGSQPPLYTWLTNAAAAVFGVHFLTLQIVKFSLLASMFLSVYGGARLLDIPKPVAVSAMLGLFLIPQIAWESQRALTHSVASTTACAWAFLAFAWHMRSRSWLSAFFLGLAPVAALLGKFNATFFVASLFLAGLSIPAYRAVLLSRKSILSVITFVVALAPTALWMLAHSSQVLGRVSKLHMNKAGDVISARLIGLFDMAWAGVNFVGVALFVFILLWIFNRRGKPAVSPAEVTHDGTRLVQRQILIAISLVAIGVLFSGATEVKDRWLQPVLFMSPLVLLIIAARYGATAAGIRNYGIIGAVFAVIISPALAYYLTYGSDKPPVGQLDYRSFYAQVQKAGPFTSMLADGPQVPANFRLLGETANIVHAETTNAEGRLTKPVLVLWNGKGPPPQTVANILVQANIDPGSVTPVQVEIPYLNRPGPVRYFSFMVVGN